MSTVQMHLPSLGDGDIEGTVLGFMVNEGDDIAEGDIVVEVETDKVVMEIPAEASGKVQSIHLDVGASVKAGALVLDLETKGAGVVDEDGKTEAEVVSEAIAKNTSEDATEHSAAKALNQQSHLREASLTSAQAIEEPTQVGNIPAGPSVRRLARELGVSLAEVTGSGPRQRISKDDLKQHVKQALGNNQQGNQSRGLSPTLPDFSQWTEVRAEPLSRISQTTAANMQRAWSEIPHAWLVQEVDITDLENQRKALKSRLPNLTITALLCRALAKVLIEFPNFNASYDVQNQQLIVKESLHLGVAVDTDRGLVVPALRDANQKDLSGIVDELSRLGELARSAKLTPKDFGGAAMTLSNLGGLGTHVIYPVVNWPELSILGVGRAIEQWRKGASGEGEWRLILSLTLAFDHRVLNGADGARFLSRLKQLLESPLLML